MVKDSSEIIQAFPIQPNTYTGVPSAFVTKGFSVIHVGSECDITFDFGTQGTVIVAAKVGQDFAIHSSCQTITASVDCIIS